MDGKSEDRALEALIVMALRFDEDIIMEDITEENLPELTKEEIDYFHKRGPEILEIIKSRKAKENGED